MSVQVRPRVPPLSAVRAGDSPSTRGTRPRGAPIPRLPNRLPAEGRCRPGGGRRGRRPPDPPAASIYPPGTRTRETPPVRGYRGGPICDEVRRGVGRVFERIVFAVHPTFVDHPYLFPDFKCDAAKPVDLSLGLRFHPFNHQSVTIRIMCRKNFQSSCFDSEFEILTVQFSHKSLHKSEERFKFFVFHRISYLFVQNIAVLLREKKIDHLFYQGIQKS